MVIAGALSLAIVVLNAILLTLVLGGRLRPPRMVESLLKLAPPTPVSRRRAPPRHFWRRAGSHRGRHTR